MNLFPEISVFLVGLAVLLRCIHAGDPDAMIYHYHWAIVNASYIDPKTNQLNTPIYRGKYGAHSHVDERTGVLVHARTASNETDGCRPYAYELPEEEDWIALAERGVCYFSDKIKIATKTHGASAIIVYNSDGGEITLMQHTVHDEVSVFVARDTGITLATLVDSGVRVMVTVAPGQKRILDSTPKDVYDYTTVIVGVVGVCLVCFAAVALFAWLAKRRRPAGGWSRFGVMYAGRNGDRGMPSDGEALCLETDVKT